MSESSPYDVDFEWDGAHGRLVTLLRAHLAPPGIVVDLGCGYAPHASVLEEAGFSYVGFDVDPASVAEVRHRGHSAEVLDLGDADAVIAALDHVSAEHDAAVIAVLAIDVIEHLVDPHVLLAEIAAWMRRTGVETFGVSVPNVAHHDVAVKLLAGRWDVTPSGLLDHTHVRFFTDRSLTAVFESCGFVECRRADRPAAESDQRWPLSSRENRLSSVVRGFRGRVDGHGDTYQFIRLYAPAAPAAVRTPTLVIGDRDLPTCFLSVVAPPNRDGAAVAALRAQLAAQTSEDWELVTAVAAEFAGSSRSGALGALVGRASGAFVAIVEPGDELDPTWVAEFAAIRRDGVILRTARKASGDVAELGDQGDLGDLGDLGAASAGFAFPVEALSGPVVVHDGIPAGLSLFLDLFQYCGVAETAVATVATSAADSIDQAAVARRLAVLDAEPMVVPQGEIGRRRAVVAAARRIGELDRHVAELEADNAWLSRELSIAPVRALRKLLRRPRSRG